MNKMGSGGEVPGKFARNNLLIIISFEMFIQIVRAEGHRGGRGGKPKICAGGEQLLPLPLSGYAPVYSCYTNLRAVGILQFRRERLNWPICLDPIYSDAFNVLQ